MSAKPGLEGQTRWEERQGPEPWGTAQRRGEGCFEGRGAPRPREKMGHQGAAEHVQRAWVPWAKVL